ncbi:mechanosensitive ion channel family protein [Roseateles sp. DB2]|uniref:mechanosensitive ion channel family protein n=1 Tax=Roseateles sp. DB2 TaxID=3453717 RepID=UPI003EF015AE
MTRTCLPAQLPKIPSLFDRLHQGLCLLLAALLMALPQAGLAQASAAAPASAASAASAVAAALPASRPALAEPRLQLAGRDILVFRAGSLGLSPADRQRRAQAQLQAVLEMQSPDYRVELRPTPEGRALLVNGQLIGTLMPGDLGLDASAEPDLDQRAQAAKAQLQQALAEHQEAHSWQRLGLAALWVLGSLALLLPLLWALRKMSRISLRLLARGAGAQARKLQVSGVTLLSLDRLGDGVRLVVRLLHAGLWLLLVYEWLGWALRQFPYTRVWGEQLHAMLRDALGGLLIGAASALPQLLVAILIFVLAHFLSTALDPFFERAESGAVDLGWLDADTARPTRRLLRLGIWAFAVAMAYPYLPGAQTEAFKGLSVLIGLMASLGASSVVGQAAAGLILMYTRTLRIGEYVRIGEHEGTVTELGTFATRIRTGQGDELTLPNALIAGSVTRNYSRTGGGAGFALDTTVTIGYDTAWRQVEAMLKLAAARTPGILQTPAPRVFQTALSDFYVEYRLVVQAQPTEPGPRAQVLSLLHAEIQDVFNEFGVQIMSPHYLGDPAEAKVVPPARWRPEPVKGDPAGTPPSSGRRLA